MTAGVQQSIEPAAYLPSPPTNSSADAKKAGADGQSAAAQGDSQDFQTELKLQQADAKADRDTSAPKSSSGRTDPTASARPDKKRDSQADDLNEIAVPVAVAETPDPKQPLALILSVPEESTPAEPTGQTAPVGEPVDQHLAQTKVETNDLPQLPARIVELLPQASSPESEPPSKLPNPQQAPVSTKSEPSSVQPEEKRERVENPAPLPRVELPSSAKREGPPKKDAAILPVNPQAGSDALRLTVSGDAPAQAPSAQSENPQSSGKDAPVLGNSPAPQVDFSLPAAPQEPATSAIHETVDPASSRPAALAFAARLSPIPENQPGVDADNAAPARAIPNPAALARIPMRYAPTAQILPNSEDSDPQIDRTFRVSEIRSDAVVARPDSSHQSAGVSDPAPAPEAVPTARAERVIEPPAAAPASPHDIRVRVPDNNGGATQVRFVESGGEVRISVRTDDPTLAQNLRTHLNDLTQRLTDSGIPAEIWRPGNSPASAQSSEQSPDREGRGSDGQQSAGNGGQQQHRDNRRPRWLEEMEASLHAQA